MQADVNYTTLADWLAYLEQLHPKQIDLGLDRVRQVQQALGLVPSFPVIAVGGTNGKGSVCALLESILTAAGYRVGCYTSPHLIRYNERIRILQIEVTDSLLLQAFYKIEQSRKQCGVSLTYFEFGTLAAMYLFINECVDVAILEVGLGGRMDAVNIFDADCAILASIDLDHQDYLGDSREAIGFEKAGIFRRGKPAVSAEADLPYSVTHYAEKMAAQLLLINRDFGFSQENDQWCFQGQNGQSQPLPLPALRGVEQLRNASACLAALEQLQCRLPVTWQAVRVGLLKVTLPGRMQVLSMQPMIVLDVAHNPAAAQALAKNLEVTQSSGKTYGVFSMLKDKDIAGVVKALKPHIDVWLIASVDTPRAAKTELLLSNLDSQAITPENHTIHEFKNVTAAYVFACEHVNKNDRICVFGSFYTVGDVLKYFEKQSAVLGSFE